MVISGYKKVWEDSDKVEISSMNILGLVEMDDILPYFAKWQKETEFLGIVGGKFFLENYVKEYILIHPSGLQKISTFI